MSTEATNVMLAKLNKSMEEQVNSTAMHEAWKLVARTKYTRMQIYAQAGFTPEQAFQLVLHEGAK